MHRFLTMTCLALAICALFGVSTASAQVVQVYYPTPVVSYYSAPVYVAPAPTVTYYQPAPTVTYYQPAPAVAYYQPVTSYYAPAVAYTPGVVTTRSYVGLGIFRPRGVYTQSYYSPYVTSYYYAPRFYR